MINKNNNSHYPKYNRTLAYEFNRSLCGSHVQFREFISTENWLRFDDYGYLLETDCSALAWEWLRRTELYRTTWARNLCLNNDMHLDSRLFGLERFENPALPTRIARPVWSAAIDPAVIKAKIQDGSSPCDNRIDLRAWSHLVRIAIDDHDVEHLLLSDGKSALRIDVLNGTLLGCPANLEFIVDGVEKIETVLGALNRLLLLKKDGRLRPSFRHTRQLRLRWILELRVADALRDGAGHREIAQELFGAITSGVRWRSQSDAARQRVQRLARRARERLANPLDPEWFRHR